MAQPFSTLIAQAPGTNTGADADLFGTLTPPAGVTAFDAAAGGGENIGLIIFISNLLQVATIIAGVWVLFQLILAGYQYITANGDTGAHNKVKDRVTMSLLGLAIIVASYTVAGVIGLIFFGNAAFILNPQLPTPPGGTP